MYVSDWMTKKVFTIAPEDCISDALKLMKDKCIRHLPVVKGDRIKGILSDRDIREFTPSSATTLDVYELHYLLAKTRIKEIMRGKVISTTPDTPIEEAAMVLYDSLIGCLPVVDNGKLEGIISDRDIFRALIDITGVRHGGNRISLCVEDRPGSIKEVADVIRKYGFSLQGLLTSYEGVRSGYRHIVIRTKGRGSFIGLKNELQKLYRDVTIGKGK
jgi:acetoin utilization protein AcuB